MNETELRERRDQLQRDFESGSIFTAPDSALSEHLKTLCVGSYVNIQEQYREMIRGLTINHIQMARVIERLNKQNSILSWVVIILAVVSIIASLAGAIF